jgi:hypothetical protein
VTGQSAPPRPASIPAFAAGSRVSRRAALALKSWIEEERVDIPALLTGAAAWPVEARIVLLLVAADAGFRLPHVLVRAVLESAPEDAYLPMLVGACDGDRVEMLLDAVESRHMTVERDVFLLLLAAELLGTVGPPRFQRALRLACRHDLYEEEKGLALLAAQRSGDADTKRLARLVTAAPGKHAERVARDLRRDLESPSIERLPEDAVSTEWPVTVRRTVPKVGRNDPCPCGSGRKYKKCCEEKDAERAADPSPVPGVTMAEYRTTSSHLMSVEDFASLRVDEMLEADRSRLTSLHLIRAIRRATAFQRFDAVELFMEELAKRRDLPKKGSPDGYRIDAASDALIAGRLDVAERQIAAMNDPGLVNDAMRFTLHFLRKESAALDLAERLAEAGLRGGIEHLELAHSLLDHSPALGILVARGALEPERLDESDTLADEIGRARDRLLLSPFDPAVTRFDDLVDGRLEEEDLEEDLEKVVSEKRALSAETLELRRRIRDQAARAAELERQIRRKARQEKESRPATGAPAAPDDERRRLASKLEELKALLAASNEERADLRKRVSALADQPATKPARPTPEQKPELEPGEDVDSAPEGRGVRIPRFSKSVEDALRAQTVGVARDALQTIAEIATGSFRGVKRLVKAKEPLYSARVGIHHRLLFRPSESRLEVLELVHRQELEAAIKRYL